MKLHACKYFQNTQVFFFILPGDVFGEFRETTRLQIFSKRTPVYFVPQDFDNTDADEGVKLKLFVA